MDCIRKGSGPLSSAIRASMVIVLLIAFALVACYPSLTIAANSDGVSYKISGQKITLSWGSKPTAGYKININSVKRSGTTLTVTYSLTSPSPGTMAAQVITYPKAVANIPKGPAPKKVLLVRKGSAATTVKKTTTSKTTLPAVGTADNLKKLLAECSQYQQRYYLYDSMVMKAVPAPTAAPMETGAAKNAVRAEAAASGDYSKTNVQVEGVDEADIVKTDGNYIYQVNNQKIYIIKAKPAAKMTVTDTVTYANTGFNPSELYVDNNRLVVIGSYYESGPIVYDQVSPKVSARSIMPPRPTRDTVKAVVYDISNKQNVKKVREIDIEGSYVSSRKIGNSLYLVANKWINYYADSDSSSDLRPYYKDSTVKTSFLPVNYTRIHYFPGCIEPNYIIIAGLDVSKKDPAKVTTYLGSGQNVYCSDKNLYVAMSKYNYQIRPLASKSSMPVDSNTQPSTNVYRFALKSGEAVFSEKGEVPGTILDQFSMDENGAYFRIATTSGESWRTDEGTSKNNVYVLNSKMAIEGKLENIAPGEKIYSTRFMGNRVYMVTFKQVDPFFVIDLKNPKQPKVLGALKIPGYSDYLHPYDENHVIGFGKDTVETKAWGNQSQAFYMGMKIAIFDVTNVAKPVEMYKETIGDRGTDSELLRNHKALLFSREKNLLAFPVTVMRVDSQSATQENGVPSYGSFAFQGAYVYNIDLAHGFTLKGRITHLSDEDYLKAGQSWYSDQSNIDRILYIGNDLYTLSKSMIKSNNLSTLLEEGKLKLAE